MDESSADRNDGRSVVSTRTMEAVVAVLLFLFGATFVYQSVKLGFRWAVEGPQSGFFPFYVALIICGSSLVVFVNALRGNPASAISFSKAAADCGTLEACFSSSVLPADSCGARMRAIW